jgi:hypothetical protein
MSRDLSPFGHDTLRFGALLRLGGKVLLAL